MVLLPLSDGSTSTQRWLYFPLGMVLLPLRNGFYFPLAVCTLLRWLEKLLLAMVVCGGQCVSGLCANASTLATLATRPLIHSSTLPLIHSSTLPLFHSSQYSTLATLPSLPSPRFPLLPGAGRSREADP